MGTDNCISRPGARAGLTKSEEFMARILIIDDDPLVSSTLTALTEDMGFEAAKASTLSEGVQKAREGDFDVVYLDVDMPDGNGMEAIPDITESPSNPEVILFTSVGGAKDKDLVKTGSGVWDLIEKPASLEAVRLPLVRAMQYRAEKKASGAKPLSFKRGEIVGSGKGMRRLLVLAAQAAKTGANVLVSGETGTGRGLLARAIHNESTRASGPFVIVECSALTRAIVESELAGRGRTGEQPVKGGGVFSGAYAGTLFLDEVGDLPGSVQEVMLQLLKSRMTQGAAQENAADFRLIASTNRNLESMSKSGFFLQELLDLLKQETIHVPALRERPDDVPELAMHYAAKICQRFGFPPKSISSDLLELLAGYDWPGNVSELIDVLEDLVSTNRNEPVLYPKHLTQNLLMHALGGKTPEKKPAPVSTTDWTEMPNTWKSYKRKCEKAYFKDLMEFADYDLNGAAEISELGIHSLYKYLKRNGIPTKHPRRRHVD